MRVGRVASMELPELIVLSQQMNKEIAGKRIGSVEVANAKCLNMPYEQFRKSVVRKVIKSVENRGKWLFIKLGSGQTLLFNPGMGADVIHFKSADKLPEKYGIKFVLEDKTGFTIRAWWFCYLHLVHSDKISEHKLAGKLGISPLDKQFTVNCFKNMLKGKKGNIKAFLLDQKNIAGIGNVYIQDTLFLAKLHPQRLISSLTDEEIEALHRSMQSVLKESIKLGGLAYEKDFYGNKGKFGTDQFKVGYKEGKPCPVCGTPIQKIKTGSTSTFICPKDQRMSK